MDHRSHPKSLLILLVVISALSVMGETPPDSLSEFLTRSLPALVLLAAHAFVHARGLGSIIFYHVVQSTLVAGIGLVSGSVSSVITLTAWMCGETVAAELRSRARVIATGWHAAVGLGVIVLVAGAQSAVQWIVAAVPTVAFVIVVILLYARESRARESAEELARELADSNRRIAEYAEAAAFRSREQERQRMARDLHDTLAQGLTGVILQIRAAGTHLENGQSETASSILSNSLDQAQQTLREARRAIQDLREADALDAAGTITGGSGDAGLYLQRLCDNLTNRYGCPVTFSARLGDDPDHADLGADAGATKGVARRSAPLAGSTLFELAGILGEAVHNAVRHGACETVEVSLESGATRFQLVINDDGRGFDVGGIPERGHYGIQGMQERARVVGASLEIDSSPGHGTRIAVTGPLSGADAQEVNDV